MHASRPLEAPLPGAVHDDVACRRDETARQAADVEPRGPAGAEQERRLGGDVGGEAQLRPQTVTCSQGDDAGEPVPRVDQMVLQLPAAQPASPVGAARRERAAREVDRAATGQRRHDRTARREVAARRHEAFTVEKREGVVDGLPLHHAVQVEPGAARDDERSPVEAHLHPLAARDGDGRGARVVHERREVGVVARGLELRAECRVDEAAGLARRRECDVEHLRERLRDAHGASRCAR